MRKLSIGSIDGQDSCDERSELEKRAARGIWIPQQQQQPARSFIRAVAASLVLNIMLLPRCDRRKHSRGTFRVYIDLASEYLLGTLRRSRRSWFGKRRFGTVCGG